MSNMRVKQIDLNSWVEFKPTIDDIRQKFGYHEYPINDDQVHKDKNVVLFRGQACAEWLLKTTLERKTNLTYTALRYLSQVTKLAHELESHTGTKWDVADFMDLKKEMKENQDHLFGPRLPRLDFLIYLRHHGYPSPLLDWTESPYIAAYFAMFDAYDCEASPEKRCAVYTYIDSLDNIRSVEGGKPAIRVIGPYVSTHKRHFIQKAWYTIASRWASDHDDYVFCSHHDVFDNPNQDHLQDLLIKITIPISEKKLVLKELDDFNINHFTLFQTEDSLVKALSTKNFDFNGS